MIKILIVDDEDSIRFVFHKILTDAGHAVEAVANLDEARAVLDAECFDVAVIDRLLSDGQNGLELVRYIRMVQPFCQSIMVSAYPTFESASEIMRYETFAYLVKPVKKKEFREVVIEAALKSREKVQSKKIEKLNFSILTSSADAIVITDLEGRTRYVNPSFKNEFGWIMSEVKGKLIPFLPESERESTMAIIHDLVKNGTPCHDFETKRNTKDGRLMDVSISASRFDNHEGKPDGMLFILRDISEKKSLEAQLSQARKLEAIGTLAGGIAHDFNNILFPILGYAEMTLADAPEHSAIGFNMEESIKAINRARELIMQILTYSHSSENKHVPLQIHPIVNEALLLLRASLPSTIEINRNISKSDGHVLCDPIQIHEIILNLCANARHAMRENGGVLNVTLNETEMDFDDANAENLENPEQYLKLTVSDTGCGMKQEVLERIFDPYFTTKETGEGTGLGLSVVHGIVGTHGGHITVDSEPGKGTTFEILLPRTDAAVDVSMEPAPESDPTGNESILLVDDEEQIVQMETKMLQKLGYDVMGMTDASDALEAFSGNPFGFDVVITDMTMPLMTGVKFSQKVLEIRPNMPIILCTGHSEQISDEMAESMGISEFVTKPVSQGDLARIIRRALNGFGKVRHYHMPGYKTASLPEKFLNNSLASC